VGVSILVLSVLINPRGTISYVTVNKRVHHGVWVDVWQERN